MKHIKLTALLIIAALSIAAVSSAALNGISFNRNVSAGQILVDTDDNVAVQFTNISEYTDLVKAGTDGRVMLNLNNAISNNVSSGFNADAVFTIGTSAVGAVRIKNNSDIPVSISMTGAAGNAITVSPVNSSSLTIAAGSFGDYYFTVNTSGQDALKSMNATLHVEAK